MTRVRGAAWLVGSAGIAVALGILLFPRVRAWSQERHVDAYMGSDRYLAVLARDNPRLREPIRELLLRCVKTGQRERATSEAAPVLAAVFPKYVARAQDAEALRLGRNFVTFLQAVATTDRTLCYRVLFPQRNDPITEPLRQHAPPDFVPSIEAVVRGAIEHPVEPPSLDEVKPQLLLVLDRLDRRFGPDSALLDEADKPGVDRGRACSVVTGLYEEVVGLSDDKAGPLLRYLFSRAQGAAPEK